MKDNEMDSRVMIRLGARRLAILFVISLALVFLGSEGAYIFQKEAYDRAPRVVELVIPQGTAEQIAAGKAVPSIPAEMVFVVGDTLVVHNEDSADHVLGPVWVPAGTSASLAMEKASKMAYDCSFQSSRYLGLEVKQPTTWRTRLTALALAAPATTVFLFVYSLVIFPLQPPKNLSVSLRSRRPSSAEAISLLMKETASLCQRSWHRLAARYQGRFFQKEKRWRGEDSRKNTSETSSDPAISKRTLEP